VLPCARRVVDFPSLKAKQFLAILKREPLKYVVVKQTGSHRKMESGNNYPKLTFSYHDGATVPPGVVRKYLVDRIGLTEEEAIGLL
jgi:predicted RNA binding protein YcfA (HicA-like mRNA interferase family)